MFVSEIIREWSRDSFILSLFCRGKIFLKYTYFGAGQIAQVVARLPSKQEAPSSNPNTIKIYLSLKYKLRQIHFE
jgi:hypothetical protein